MKIWAPLDRFDAFMAPVAGEPRMAFCPQCGKPVESGAAFCTACGHALAPPPAMSAPAATVPAPAPYAAPVVPAAPAARVRPIGVTIIGIVSIIAGAFLALGAVAVLMFALFGASMMQAFGDEMWPFEVGGAFIAFFAVIALLFIAAFAGLAFAAGFGSLQGRSWAWGLTIVLMGLNALNGLGELAGGIRDGTFLSGVLTLAVSGLVVWYYFQPDVKAWFGRS